MKTIEFYEALAHLFFGVANATTKMSLLEQKRLNDIIRTEWSEELGEHSSEEVLFGIIRKLSLEKAVWRPCLEVFKKHYEANEMDYSEALKEQIMRSSEDIVFAGQRRTKPTIIMLLTRLFWG